MSRKWWWFIGFAVVIIGSYCIYSINIDSSTKAPAAHAHHNPPAVTQSRTQPRRDLPRMSLTPSEPSHITIEKIGVNQAVDPLSLNDKGEMAAPTAHTAVGWYKHGYLPGSLGSAVLAGHYWHKNGKGVFAELGKLYPGDEIRLKTKTSMQIYKVVQSKKYTADHHDTNEVFGPSTMARLNLITCNGAWDAQEKRYANRLVVFSEFVREETTPEH